MAAKVTSAHGQHETVVVLDRQVPDNKIDRLLNSICKDVKWKINPFHIWQPFVQVDVTLDNRHAGGAHIHIVVQSSECVLRDKDALRIVQRRIRQFNV